jgi:hypothetical protein
VYRYFLYNVTIFLIIICLSTYFNAVNNLAAQNEHKGCCGSQDINL